MEKLVSHSLEETGKFASAWLKKISESRASADTATIVGLSGHLGSGKTAFVKTIARTLGIPETVTSPTFVLMKMYEIPTAAASPFKQLIHIDAYRLEDKDDLQALDFEAISADGRNLIMIEWPENIGLKPEDFKTNCHLRFEIKDGLYAIDISS